MKGFEFVVCFHYFFSVSLSSCYRYHYGNVVTTSTNDLSLSAQQLNNDIIQFVSGKLKRVSPDQFHILKFQKMIQYHSNDGATPTKLNYMTHRMCYSIMATIGNHYDIILLISGTIHKLTIIEDENDILKIYSYIRYGVTVQSLAPLCRKSKFFIGNTSNNNNNNNWCDINIKCSYEFDLPKVTIATYNIWNINGTREETHLKRITRLAKLLSLYDIIGLQEVRSISGDWDRSHINQIEIIGKVLHEYQYVYQPGMLYTRDKRDEEGVAIMSRFPILSTNYILLPWNHSDPSDFHQRVCLQCTIQTPLGILNVFVTHLSLSSSAQISSVIEIYKYMNTFFGPSLLMGDLNTEPNSTPIKFLNGELVLNDIQTSGVVDVWNTFHYNGGETFSSLQDEPEKRIDYIFLKDPGNICIKTIDVIGRTRHPQLSDHLGLSTTIK